MKLTENKKVLALSLLILFTITLQLTSISAFSPSDPETGVRNVIEFIKDFTSPVFEAIIGDYSTSELFFPKVMLLILLFVLVFQIVKTLPKFGENRGVVFIIALVTSVFSVRFISENQLALGVLLSYGVMGITITMILPFFIFFWFINKSNMVGPARRIAWVFFGAIFILMTVDRYSSMPPLSQKINLVLIALIILAFVFDRSIRAYFNMWEINKMEATINDRIVLDLLDQLKQAETHSDLEVGQRQAESIRKRLRAMGIKNL